MSEVLIIQVKKKQTKEQKKLWTICQRWITSQWRVLIRKTITDVKVIPFFLLNNASSSPPPAPLYGTSEHLFPANPDAVRHVAPPTAADGVTMGYRVVASSVSIPPVRRLPSSSPQDSAALLCSSFHCRTETHCAMKWEEEVAILTVWQCPSIITNNIGVLRATMCQICFSGCRVCNARQLLVL